MKNSHSSSIVGAALLLLASLLVATPGCTLFLDTSLEPPVADDSDMSGDFVLDMPSDLDGADVEPDAADARDADSHAPPDIPGDLVTSDVESDTVDASDTDTESSVDTDAADVSDVSETGDLVDCGGAPVNACGGCEPLDGKPDEPCGTNGVWVCTGPDTLVCRER